MRQCARGGYKIRLQVFLSKSRVCSRRRALELVKEGRVSVNGAVIREPSYAVSPGLDAVRLGSKEVSLKQNSYLVMNKPRGYVTTLSDRHAKLKVVDLLPEGYRHLYPVGRLDRESEGLLLFTNDGDLAFRLGHPSFKVDKVYFVQVEGRLGPGDISRLEKGIMIEGRRTHPARIDSVYYKAATTSFNITIHEGRKRQIRNMLSIIGYKVMSLRRIKYGPIDIGDMAPGKWRILSNPEVMLLKQACGLNRDIS